jgi:hypothetical protein
MKKCSVWRGMGEGQMKERRKSLVWRRGTDEGEKKVISVKEGERRDG